MFFENPKEIDYGPLFAFLFELREKNEDDQTFAYRFSFTEEKANIELIQYGYYCPIISQFVPLDGDPFVIASFLRCLHYKMLRYSPLTDIEKTISQMSYNEIAFKLNYVRDECFAFRDNINNCSFD